LFFSFNSSNLFSSCLDLLLSQHFLVLFCFSLHFFNLCQLFLSVSFQLFLISCLFCLSLFYPFNPLSLFFSMLLSNSINFLLISLHLFFKDKLVISVVDRCLFFVSLHQGCFRVQSCIFHFILI